MQNDRQSHGLQGLVCTIETETKEFAKLNGQLIEQPWLIETTTYDLQGNRIEETFNNAQHPDCTSKSSFVYTTTEGIEEISIFDALHNFVGKRRSILDQHGRTIEESSNSADGSITSRRMICFNSEGKKTEELFHDYQKFEPDTAYGFGIEVNGDHDFGFTNNGSRLTKTLYDDSGNPTELFCFNDQGVVFHKITFTADSNGRVVKASVNTGDTLPFEIPEGAEIPPEVHKIFGDDGWPITEIELRYNSKGKKEEECMLLGGAIFDRRVFIYDDLGKVIEESYYDADGKLRSRARIEREYDSQGNWIKKMVLSWNEQNNEFEPSTVYCRTITYY
jgi:YD repeat-containing protein